MCYKKISRTSPLEVTPKVALKLAPEGPPPLELTPEVAPELAPEGPPKNSGNSELQNQNSGSPSTPPTRRVGHMVATFGTTGTPQPGQ